MVLDLNTGTSSPDWAGLADRLQWAQAEVAGNAVWATGPSAHVHYAAAAVTLKLCLNGVHKMQDMPREEAALLARGNFSLTCLMPLSALAIG